jgi:hypothetical protein
MRLRLLALLFVLSTVACSGSDPAPTAPTPPPAPMCQVQNVAVATFLNRSPQTMDVFVDGGVIGTLAAGQQGLPTPLAANVEHPIQWRISNTNLFPCSAFVPVPIVCTTPVYESCTF